MRSITPFSLNALMSRLIVRSWVSSFSAISSEVIWEFCAIRLTIACLRLFFFSLTDSLSKGSNGNASSSSVSSGTFSCPVWDILTASVTFSPVDGDNFILSGTFVWDILFSPWTFSLDIFPSMVTFVLFHRKTCMKSHVYRLWMVHIQIPPFIIVFPQLKKII